MRLEELPDDRIAYKIMGDETIAHDRRSGEVINSYPKRTRPSTLYTLRSMGDLTEEMYVAGIRYSRLWEAAGRAPKYAGGDPSNPKVDGAGRAPDEYPGNLTAQRTLIEIREFITNKGADMLDAICGEDIAMTAYRELVGRRWQAVSRELRMYLERLDQWFRKN